MKKRFLSVLLILCLVLSMTTTVFAAGGTFSGTGTESDPYLIEDLADLQALQAAVNGGEPYADKYFKQTAEIDLSSVANWEPIGNENTAHGFMGNYDGQNFKIKNLTITNSAGASDYAYAGLFGITEGTSETQQNTIKNLAIENVTITTAGQIAAAAVAYPYYTILDNISVTGDIKITGGNYTAGVVAYTRRCTDASNLSISGNSGSFVKGAKTVGGVICDIQMNGGLTANYSNFSASGLTVEGETNVGGISGIISGQKLDTCSVEDVTLVCADTARVGMVAGTMGSTSTITDVTTDNVSGASSVIGGDYTSGEPVVAKVGDNYYKTLQAAIDAAGSGDTVTVLDNVALAEGLVIAADDNIILELNGKTISRNTDAAVSSAAITNNGTLTIKDEVGGGKITAFAANPDTAAIPYYANNTITNCGNLTIEGGTIENSTGNEARAAFPIDNNSTVRDAVVNIKGGKITGRGAIRQFANSTTNKNEVNISDNAEVSGSSYGIWMQNPGSGDPKAALSISGGTVGKVLLSPSANFEPSISGGTISEVAVWEADTTNTDRNPSGFISGGTFNKEVGEEFCADGYEPQTNNDGTYGVKPEGGTNNGGTVVPGGSGAGSSSPNPNVPVTGDNTPLTLLIVLMGICAAATAAIIVSRKRTSR